MTQLDLILTPPPLKAVSPVASERQRLNAAARRVLAYLQAHEWATNGELAQIGGLRFGGRLWELRRDGWVIEDQRPVSGGTWRYRLIGRKDDVSAREVFQ